MKGYVNSLKPETNPRQIPLRASGLHVHDVVPDDLGARVRDYPGLRADATPSEVATWASRHPACRTTKTEKKLLSAIANFYVQINHCQISYETLAEKCGHGRRSVIYRPLRLRALSVLTWDNETAKGGGAVKRPNNYNMELDYES